MGKYSWSDREDKRREDRRPKPAPRKQMQARKTPLPRQTKPIAKRSHTQKDRDKIYAAVRILFIMQLRKAQGVENPICQCKGCNREGTDVHHMKGKVGDLYFEIAFFLWVCRQHHDQINNNNDWAFKEGYSLSRLAID